LTTEAKNALAAEGYDPQFGARPLKRVIQHRLENAMATRILTGEFEPGDTVVVGYQGKSFTFERRPGTFTETRGKKPAKGEVIDAEVVEG
jgi:ATP-dependent Clp protease ATP-binding subunit ClpB